MRKDCTISIRAALHSLESDWITTWKACLPLLKARRANIFDDLLELLIANLYDKPSE